MKCFILWLENFKNNVRAENEYKWEGSIKPLTFAAVVFTTLITVSVFALYKLESGSELAIIINLKKVTVTV